MLIYINLISGGETVAMKTDEGTAGVSDIEE